MSARKEKRRAAPNARERSVARAVLSKVPVRLRRSLLSASRTSALIRRIRFMVVESGAARDRRGGRRQSAAVPLRHDALHFRDPLDDQKPELADAPQLVGIVRRQVLEVLQVSLGRSDARGERFEEVRPPGERVSAGRRFGGHEGGAEPVEVVEDAPRVLHPPARLDQIARVARGDDDQRREQEGRERDPEGRAESGAASSIPHHGFEA